MEIGNRKPAEPFALTYHSSKLLTYGLSCAKSVVDKNTKAAFMKETILNSF